MQNKPHTDRALTKNPTDLATTAHSAAPYAPDLTSAAPPITRAQIIAAARTHLGAPFRHQGRSPAGMDCVGLLVLLARALGQPHEDVTGYTRRATGRGFLEHFHAHLVEIVPSQARPGDVLVFVETIYPCHTGILTSVAGSDTPHLIHAHALRGCVLEEPFVGEWPAKLRFAFRFPSLVEPR